MNSASQALAPKDDDVPTPVKTKKRSQTKKAVTPKPAAKKRAKGPVTLPEAADLRLAPNGITGGKKNRYINIQFADDFVVRLYPVGYKPAEVPKVRDLMVAWLTKRLSSN